MNTTTQGNFNHACDIEGFRYDLKDLKLKLEKLNDEVAQKSNIKDVCTLIDMKAN